MIIYWIEIENEYAGKTYSRKHLEREDLNIKDMGLYSEVPLE